MLPQMLPNSALKWQHFWQQGSKCIICCQKQPQIGNNFGNSTFQTSCRRKCRQFWVNIVDKIVDKGLVDKNVDTFGRKPSTKPSTARSGNLTTHNKKARLTAQANRAWMYKFFRALYGTGTSSLASTNGSSMRRLNLPSDRASLVTKYVLWIEDSSWSPPVTSSDSHSQTVLSASHAAE